MDYLSFNKFKQLNTEHYHYFISISDKTGSLVSSFI